MLSAARTKERRERWSFDELRAREFARLDRQGLAYLDYTGSALYAESQLEEHHRLLRDGVFGNPHSEHASSRASGAVIEEARRAVLQFFDVDASTHDVCFTAGTSAAIKLVAESFPFGPEAPLLLSADNHNSVNGVREYALRAGAPVHYVPLDGALRLEGAEEWLARAATGEHGLFGFPAQSNFSGVHHPLSLVDEARRRGWRVLLDAAAFVPSHPLSLREVPADFVALSFYKLFGYPTGLGALVARRESLAELRRPWFAGGTVRFASVSARLHRLEDGHEGFEDGTPDFLSIAALPAGFALLESVGMTELRTHAATLAAAFLDGLRQLGERVEIYGPADMEGRGGAVAFNVRDRGGTIIPYWTVEARANDARVAVRGGCFCNPGASEAALRLPDARIRECLSRLGADFTPEQFWRCAGTAVGAVRASFGLANNLRDVERGLELVADLG